VDHDLDPVFPDLDYNPDPGIFERILDEIFDWVKRGKRKID